MSTKLGFIYAVVCYLVGFMALLLWIIFTGNLLPEFSIDTRPVQTSFTLALLKNIGLVGLFGLQHSVMARQSFKDKLTQYIPEHLERSTYILSTGLLLSFVLWQWEPIAGVIWTTPKGSALYYVLYALFFHGWGLLFVSSFLINHFDLFGLRQAYLAMANKPYTQLPFKIISLYKIVRHPLYLGILLGIWAIPTMTATHFLFAALLTVYLFTGIFYEEKDLVKAFGQEYKKYQARVPKIIPLANFKSISQPEVSKPTPVKQTADEAIP